MIKERDKNIMDDEWQKSIRKLMSIYSRLRLSKEDEETILKIVNKL